MWRITQELPRALANFGHGGVTLSAGAFHLLDLSLRVPRRGPTTPGASSRFGLVRFRSPLLTESILFLFLRLLRCFTSPGIACFSLPSPCRLAPGRGFRKRRWPIMATGLPHSEISGSKRVCRSPKLIAAYHVLHRLLTPRHPLCALQSLIPCFETSFHGKDSPLRVAPSRSRAAKARRPAALCRKNHYVQFGIRNMSKDRKSAHGAACTASIAIFQFLAVNQIIFYLSMWMSKSGHFNRIVSV